MQQARCLLQPHRVSESTSALVCWYHVWACCVCSAVGVVVHAPCSIECTVLRLMRLAIVLLHLCSLCFACLSCFEE